MKANKYTIGEISIFEHDIPISHLKVVGGYTFTNREIDIIACVLSGKSVKKIAVFLSISPKTVENHIHNIVLKLGRSSQESVIEFIENSDKFLLIKKHYSNLLLQSVFELELKKLSTLVTTEGASCSIVYYENNTPPAMIQLEKHLQLFGIQTFVEIQKKDENHTQFINRMNSRNPNFIFYCFITIDLINGETNEQSEGLQISNLIQKTNHVREKIIFLLSNISFLKRVSSEILSLEHIDLTKQKNYYYFFFEFLKKLFPNANFDQSISEFKKKYEQINDPFPSGRILEKTPILIKKGDITSRSLMRKKTGVLLTIIVFLTLVFSLLFLTKKQNSMEGQNSVDINGYPKLSQIKAAIPVTWGLPRQDHIFIGREKLLEELDTKLQDSNIFSKKNGVSNRLAISACAGLGGIGKTQLALQYLHHTKRPYSLKAWFPSENLDQLKEKYIEFAKILDNGKTKFTIESAILFVKEWLSKNPGWLLVYDNVESYEAIAPFLPDSGGHVILTTRQRYWPDTFKVLSVDVMPEMEAINLIQSLSSINSENQKSEEYYNIKKLAQTLGYLPLALAQASAYIKQNQITVSEYLDLYKNYEKELLSNNTFPQGSSINFPVSITWNITLSAIIKENENFKKPPLSIELLTFASYLAPEKISRQLLLAWLKKNYPTARAPELELNENIKKLWQYSMVNYDGSQFINVHRLVQTTLRHQHSELLKKRNSSYFKKDWYGKLFELLHLEFSKKITPLKDEARKKFLLPHLMYLVENYNKDFPPSENPPVELGFVIKNIGDVFQAYLWDANNAKLYYDQALKIYENNYGKNNIKFAEILTALSDTCGALGNPAQQEYYANQALDIKEEYYGKNHPNLITALDSIGAALWAQGKSEKAKKYLERSLKIGESYYGKSAVEISDTLSYLGNVYGDCGDVKSKIILLERALSIKELYYGKNHIQTAFPLENLGVLYRVLGDAARSRDLLEKTLSIQELYYGKEHVEIGETLGNLGNAYLDLKEENKAKDLFLRAISILKKYYGENHAYVARTLHHLAKTYIKMQDFEKARLILERILPIKENFYEKDHAQTTEVINNWLCCKKIIWH